MAYKNILVVGGGAIGGITAAVLTQEGENVVVLDVDKEHVQMMKKGLEITGFRELTIPVKAMLPNEFTVKDFAGWADIVLLAVKGLHTEKALTSILPFVSKAAAVVSMQNGINEETIARIVSADRTIGCSITWGGTNKGPGQLIQTTEGGFIVGQWPTGTSQKAGDTAKLLSKAFPTEVSDNIIGDRWTKLLITVSMTGVGTVAGLTYGGVVDNEVARKVALAVITETYEIGKASGVNFVDLQGISPAIFLVHNKTEFENASKIMQIGFSKHRGIKPSMWQDIEKGRKTEVDFVNGHVVRKGKEIGKPTPANELVTRIIKQIEEGEKRPGVDNLKEFDKLIAHLNQDTKTQGGYYQMSKKKIIIQVCPIGSNTLHEDTPGIPKFGKRTPYLPITPQEVAEETYRSYNAGASLVHIHARDPKTKLSTPDIKVWGEMVQCIRDKCPILIEAGGGIGVWVKYETFELILPTDEEKLNLLNIKPEPDMLTVNMGTFDFSIGRYGGVTFRNNVDYQRKAIQGIKQKGWGMELEIYDISHLYNTYRHIEDGTLSQNDHFHLDFAMGIEGGMPSTPRMLMYAVEEGKRLFPNAHWQALGISKDEYPMITMAMILGADSVRVGLEDNIYISHGELAKSNAQLVEKAVRIAHELDFEIATVDEARAILGLKKGQ